MVFPLSFPHLPPPRHRSNFTEVSYEKSVTTMKLLGPGSTAPAGEGRLDAGAGRWSLFTTGQSLSLVATQWESSGLRSSEAVPPQSPNPGVGGTDPPAQKAPSCPPLKLAQPPIVSCSPPAAGDPWPIARALFASSRPGQPIGVVPGPGAGGAGQRGLGVSGTAEAGQAGWSAPQWCVVVEAGEEGCL
jgi:hypothetical protein